MAYQRVNDLNFLTDQEYEELCGTFGDRYEKRAPNECWPWIKGTGKHGRGQLTLVGQTVPAARVAYLLYVGDIPDNDSHHGTVVRHECDNPSCVNPAHLLLGTQADNVDDCGKRGRRSRGEKHPNARLTEEQVLAIRRDPRSSLEIAEHYKVTASMVCNVKSRRVWTHLPPNVADVPAAKGKKRGRKPTLVLPEVLADILIPTNTVDELSERHGIGRGVIWRLRRTHNVKWKPK